ncbi:hypothetical protein DYB30_004351 [Aphanomyces astaci]|uniref:Uncharacterized protein n=1 Tax=Aphanomyces astaci TaxID=112090 RepID=A0A397D5W7_APHAT|nr:hypothetical protein DYB34_004080 [Aphanomyces astaci]RHY59374.1 hypothetical protein DYB30_004351 [Aphanomyces astaci]
MCIVDVEVARFLVLTKSTIDPVTLTLPRADKLKQYFQDDVYGVVRSCAIGGSLSATAWFDGLSQPPPTESLCPAGMSWVSTRPPDIPVVPKVLDFQATKQRQDDERTQRDENFNRLHALAAQPTLHAQGPKQEENEEEDDDDDGWDD